MIQLKFFGTTVLKSHDLVSDSPKKAFYKLRLEFENGQFYLAKESGYGDKIRDTRRWAQPDFDKAKKAYQRRLNEKLNPNRKSPRKYRIKNE